ncbi:MAG: phosphoribosylglycinamide formyltransferase [Bacteroidetes bacterium]|nr:phosphoribosylglycinamide formyltransferase [Bacteroidota bacterium]
MKNIAIFASGAGSNAEAIIQHFSNHKDIRVALIVTNNASAGVLKVAAKHKIISSIVSIKGLQNEKLMRGMFTAQQIEFVVLAGFLKMIPDYLLEVFRGRMVNIHPALLPAYGGKGMYGMKVHDLVIANEEKESGITIHYVNDRYDEGEIILQKTVDIAKSDTPKTLAEKIHKLEHAWYPKTIEKLLSSDYLHQPVMQSVI